LKNLSRPANQLNELSYSEGDRLAVEPVSDRFSVFFNSLLTFHLISFSLRPMSDPKSPLRGQNKATDKWFPVACGFN
jgi:hypothetical protein